MNDRARFEQEMQKMLADPKVQKMSTFVQHGGTNTLSHSIHVANTSFALAEKLGVKIDERELARGAMLHDYYLYNIRDTGFSPYRHGTRHPALALENAKRDFDLTPKEQNIIRGHMWPLTLFSFPRSKEAMLVCMADKYVATREMVMHKY